MIFSNAPIKRITDALNLPFSPKEGWVSAAIAMLQTVEKVHHIMGRTDWDRACTMEINPSAEYHFCNETLRPEFYVGEWNYEKCRKHSIFMSQGYNSIKGIRELMFS